MNYSQALSFAFEDPQWVRKLAVGGLIAFLSFYCGLIIFLGFLLIGYYLQVIRTACRNGNTELPDWSDLGKIFVDGILGTVILVYFLIVGGVGAIAIVYFATHPYIHETEMVLGIISVSLVMLVALTVTANLALVQFAQTENFAAAFSFSDLANVLKQQGANLIAITVFSIILNGILLCVGLGIFSPFTNFWGLTVQAHLFGQLARQSQPTARITQSA